MRNLTIRGVLVLLMVVCVSVLAEGALALSKQSIEEVRTEAKDIRATYAAEIRKPKTEQSEAVFEQLRKRIDDIWSGLDRASGIDETMSGLYRDLHRIDSSVSPGTRDSPETWNVWMETRRKEEVEAARQRDAEKRLAVEAAQRREAEKRAALETVQRREAAIRGKGWSPAVQEAVIARKVFVGMTPEQARMAWGPPERINETIGAAGKFEQWVYGVGQYLYFSNGRLTTIQRSR